MTTVLVLIPEAKVLEHKVVGGLAKMVFVLFTSLTGVRFKS